MALNLEQKKAVVAEVSEKAQVALAAVAAEYRGITVEEITELRVKARQEGVYLKVAKNTLVRRAVEGTDFECISEKLTGPLLFAFSMDDPGSAARLVKEFSICRWRVDGCIGFRTSGKHAYTRSSVGYFAGYYEGSNREIRAYIGCTTY